VKRFFLLCFFLFAQVSADQYVTYTMNGGRLGDNLLSYIHAEWISYRYNIPVLYKPFPYSDQFALHRKPVEFDPDRVIVLDSSDIEIDPTLPGNTLYDIPYFPDSQIERKMVKILGFDVDWEDQTFLARIRGLLQPLQATRPLLLPKDRIGVALHVRVGGGFDDSRTARSLPAKFPPTSFYIEQIRKIYGLCGNRPLYVHLFTDDKVPGHLIDTFKKYLKPCDIAWGTRIAGNKHDSHVIEDFMAMMQFEYMVRPDSNFSRLAEKLGNFRIVISPARMSQKNKITTIDDVDITIREEL
jgi:hypothetical protein